MNEKILYLDGERINKPFKLIAYKSPAILTIYKDETEIDILEETACKGVADWNYETLDTTFTLQRIKNII